MVVGDENHVDFGDQPLGVQGEGSSVDRDADAVLGEDDAGMWVLRESNRISAE